MKNYFGTDGIRFIYQESIKDFILRIGFALSKTKFKTIYIGHDTRFSSEEIVNLLASQLPSKKIEYIGICSTPCVSYLSQKYQTLGVMITASHNPYQYNGIKIFNKGLKLSEKEQIKFSSLIDLNLTNEKANYPLKINQSLLKEYLSFLKKEIKASKKKYVFDAGNGSLSPYIHEIITSINKENIAINTSFDGYNINHSCGAVSCENLQKYLKENNYEYGFAFDGDGDRILLVSQNHIYSGNQILYLLNQYYHYKDVVLTKCSSVGDILSFEKQNTKTHLVDVGDSHILDKCLKNHIYLGGEDSGHIIQLKKLITGDGLLNSITLINILENNTLDELLKNYQESFSELISLEVKNKSIIDFPIIKNLINDIKNKYQNQCQILLRKSGTENKIRLFLSFSNQEDFIYYRQKIITYLMVYDNKIKYNNIDSLIIDEKSLFEEGIELIGHVQIINSSIKANTVINNSIIRDSQVSFNCSIGPYSHIRDNCQIEDHVKIGNFVEIKNSKIGRKTKISHLSYLGDCLCGEEVNFGCGSITVNYDGKEKHQTIIGNKVFIGCNSNLIAPITIGDNSFIAAGSTITDSINNNAFTIARAKQVTKENKAQKYPYFQED